MGELVQLRKPSDVAGIASGRLGELDDLERQVLSWRWGLGGVTLDDEAISIELSCDVLDVWEIEARALSILGLLWFTEEFFPGHLAPREAA